MIRILPILFLLLATTAHAAPPDGMISKPTLDRFSKILHLDKDQSDSAAALYDGYSTAFRTATRDFTTESRRIREADAPKSPELAEHTAAAFKAKTDRQAALEKSFLSDLRALLTTDQEKSWPSVERARRRELVLRGVISGESIDLIQIVDSLRLTPDESTPLAEPLTSYELDLDRALLDKDRILKDEKPFDALNEFNSVSLMKRTTQTRDFGLTIRDLNDRHARQIEATLPEPRRAAFRTAVHTAGFPSVYATSHGSKLLAAAAKLADLDPAQREKLESLRKTYERDLAAANAKLEEATRDFETSKQSIVMTMNSGGTMQVMLGKFEDNPILKAAGVKRDLDTKLREQLEKLLRPTQVDALPDSKETASDEQIFMDDVSVMIRRGG